MKKIFLSAILLTAALFFSNGQSTYVNPLIGTAEHGHTFPGAIVPFGAVQLSPDTRLDGWDGCSGYHYSDNRIYGFTHTHLSGTGCSDYGDILVMPFCGTPSIDNTKYSATFSHKNEYAIPGYYRVKFDNGIIAELTTTQHVGVHRYTFSGKGKRGIVIDLTHRDKVLASGITHKDNEFFGFRRSEAWNPNQYCAFSLIPSEPVQRIEYYADDQLVSDHDVRGENCKAILYFADDVKSVVLKVAISPVDIQGAMNNQTELNSFDFDQVKANAQLQWDKELRKIRVESKNKEYLTVFYTALYHCFTSPYLYSDVDGRYRGQDGEIHEGDSKHQVYTVFSLWDTYRALHPLLNLIDRQRTEDFLHTFLQHYRQGGMLPVWELSAHETWCMIGYHSIPVIWDAYQKGMHNYDVNEMLDAMVHSATLSRLGRPEYAQYGYIPNDADNESVSKTLEYAYDDWCIAQFAKAIGNEKVYKEFIVRAQSYKNLMDPNRFMHAKGNGGFATPFNPTEVNNFYTEANCWQYSTYVPQDLYGYVKMMGCADFAHTHWYNFFHGNSEMTGRNQSDITGLIGQYAHGNEPSHHAAYLFDYIGECQYTQSLVRKILTELYTTQPDGLCGNEDCGQMSAWYVFSAMGFYPVCPGSNQYAIGYPLFDKVTVSLENGKMLVISRDKELPYIKAVYYNGKKLDAPFISYEMISNGGQIEFEMCKEADAAMKFDSETILTQYGKSIPESEWITPTPYFSTDQKRFSQSLSIEIQPIAPDKNYVVQGFEYPVNCKFDKQATELYYTLDGSTPAPTHGTKYTGAITITDNATLKAIAYNETTGASKVVEAHYTLFDKNKSLTYVTKPNPQYYEGGDDGLVDNLRGQSNWRVGGWQGFAGDFEAIVDLHKSQDIHEVSIGCLEDVRAWIFFPAKVEIYVSDNGTDYTLYGSTDGIGSEKSEEAKLHEFVVNGNATGRYLKVKITNYGKMPSWHVSAGEQAWLFIDEISVK